MSHQESINLRKAEILAASQISTQSLENEHSNNSEKKEPAHTDDAIEYSLEDLHKEFLDSETETADSTKSSDENDNSFVGGVLAAVLALAFIFMFIPYLISSAFKPESTDPLILGKLLQQSASVDFLDPRVATYIIQTQSKIQVKKTMSLSRHENLAEVQFQSPLGLSCIAKIQLYGSPKPVWKLQSTFCTSSSGE